LEEEIAMTLRYSRLITCSILLMSLAMLAPLSAQQILGTITGTVKDSSGSTVPDVAVRAVNVATNLEVNAKSQGNGSYSIPDLPAGTY
jgi:hypothetical protein